jgi:putative nucleotidyltransferase with HDIG domain
MCIRDRDQDWLDFLQALTGQAAIAVNNANLFQQQQRSNKELQMAYDFTLEGWAHALELRDVETEGHARRVSNLTVDLARFMWLSERDLIHLRRGAILHDIGKMGIPDSILFKPGSLTDEEWRIMRQHPLYGYEMLKPIEFLKPALSVVRSHHEKWDGSGYPDGLAGETIPLFARIFAVADVWDSLTHARPYKAAWSKEDSRKFIVSQSGIHFDPQVIKIFLEIIKKDEYQLEGSFPALKEPLFQIGKN